MKFCDKLKAQRTGAGLTQEELARRLELSKRTVEGYESGSFYPRNREVYDKLSDIFHVPKNWFLTEDDAESERSASEEAAELVARAQMLYSGGKLDTRDRDALFRALTDAYFTAKQKRGESK